MSTFLNVNTQGVRANAPRAGAHAPHVRKPRATKAPRVALVLLGLAFGTLAAQAQDPENCLSCHRFRGLSRLDPNTSELRLFFCSAEYFLFRHGAHARLRCTDCHLLDEVKVIPHNVQTPVDCTRTCHIAPATGTELRFSHAGVADSLAHSVHAPAKLAELKIDPPLLRPGQSACLYCHDQPTFGFRLGVPEGFLDHRGGTRCDTCHTQELPLEISYFSKHVAARMKPARPVRQLAQVCAVCHSDPALVVQMKTHDAVGSYLHSFHGKASLLGSTETATCVDCHSSPEGDQHLMLPPEDIASSVNVAQLPDTCRTTVCHPGYPPEMSAAAVHLQLDPRAFPVEYTVAAFFIVLTAATMAAFLLLIILELLNAMVRPADRETQRLVQLARLLRDHPEGRELVQRMTLHQRLQHWGLVITFAALVYTGMPIKFADAGWAQAMVNAIGGLSVARLVHRVAGVGLIVVFLYHLTYLAVLLVGQMRRDRAAGVRVPLWKRVLDYPMMILPRDFRQARDLLAFLFFRRKERPHSGKFNFTQKFEYWAVFWGVPIMGLSGLALWSMPLVSQWLSGRAINFAFIIHSDEAYLAFIYIATVHLFGVIFAPAVFPLSLGTLSGQAPAMELAETHRRELERIAGELGLILPPHAPEPGGWARRRRLAADALRRVYSAALVFAYGALTVVSMGFLLNMLLGHQSAPVEIVNIPKRLDADTFLAAASTPLSADVPSEGRPRGPLAHFHVIPQWFQPDPGNSCTTSGCHAALPHGQRIEVRAFLNMHSTFVDCMVCHTAQPAAGQPGWIALPERTPSAPPALLRLAGRLHELESVPPEQAERVNAELIDLLAAALPGAGHNAQLENWLLRLRTTNPRSRVWQNLLQELRARISWHVHGEYGEKIALLAGGQPAGALNADQQAATKEYLRGKDRLSESQRQTVLDRVHAGVAPTGAMCTPCHAEQPQLLNLAQLGFPPGRVEELQTSSVLRSILSIEAGQPFYLPLETKP